jgi:membrane protease subunit HflC
MRASAFLLPAVVVAVVAAASSVFIVDERQKALVLQFGQIVKVQEDPGLGFKLPFLQEVVRYDDRILSRDLEPLEITPSDDRRLVVDAFARYRIADVEQFRQALVAVVKTPLRAVSTVFCGPKPVRFWGLYHPTISCPPTVPH